MTDPVLAEVPTAGIERLRWVYAGLVGAAAVLLFVAAVLDAEDVGGGLPAWFSALVLVAIAVPEWFVIRYFRRRPHEEPGLATYAKTVLFRAGVAMTPAVAGFALFLASGSWLVQLLGVALAVPGLAWSAPSVQDYARHRRLATEIAPPPPKEMWGNTPPGYVAPWEDEHGGHGHGLTDH